MSNCGVLLKLSSLPQYNCYQKEVISSWEIWCQPNNYARDGTLRQLIDFLVKQKVDRALSRFFLFCFLYFLQLYNLCVVKQTETSLKVKNKILMSSHSYSYSKFVHGQHSWPLSTFELSWKEKDWESLCVCVWGGGGGGGGETQVGGTHGGGGGGGGGGGRGGTAAGCDWLRIDVKPSQLWRCQLSQWGKGHALSWGRAFRGQVLHCSGEKKELPVGRSCCVLFLSLVTWCCTAQWVDSGSLVSDSSQSVQWRVLYGLNMAGQTRHISTVLRC